MSIRRALTITPSLLFIALLVSAPAASASADDAPPSQALDSDPGPPFPRIGLSADGVSIALGDYALRIEGAPDPWHAPWLNLGASRRHGPDTLLIEAGWGIWPLGWGLEGLYVSPAIGVNITGPWNGEDADAQMLLRAGGEAGWQFLWADVSITVAAGAMAIIPLEGGEPWPEPRLRVSLGFVLR